jgi:hypothetical protein
MKRRELLLQFRNFCLLYGIGGILSPQSFGQVLTPKKRLVTFVIKYTGGGTGANDLGLWTFDQPDSLLSPLKPYRNEMAFQLGLSCKYTTPMNSHAAPQIAALTGAMTANVRISNTDYPTDTLQNYSTGGGSSIDILIGQKLQSTYGTQIPHIAIANTTQPADTTFTSGFASSSWTNGKLNTYISSVNNLSTELKQRINCNSTTSATLQAEYQRKLEALALVQKNQLLFESKYVIDKDHFANLQEKLQKCVDKYKAAISGSDLTAQKPTVCTTGFPTETTTAGGGSPGAEFEKRMNGFYDLAIAAFQANVTRSITFNLYNAECHHTSHYVEYPSYYPQYVYHSRYLQQSVANFLAKLKAAGLYDETLIFCNAGSSMANEVHNYENMSTYVINGDKSGVVGSTANPKPIGSLLLDILYKFGINYPEYGGTNHVLGVAKKGNFLG